MTDERVTAAISHWAPRFVANGVPLTDFQEVTGGVERWEEWCGAWAERAGMHEQLGREALDAGRRQSAGAHLTTAAVCYHFGKFLFVQDVEEMRAAHRRAVACRTDALALVDPPGERVAVPFEGTSLYGNLRRPSGVERPPVVVMCMGLDSAKEEMHAYEQLFLARGLATFAFDGPGQGEAEYDLPIRGDYEVPVAAVVDHLQARPDLDGDRIGLWGVSLGGYYAPRAAAFEKRVRACISLSGPYDWEAGWDALPDLTREAFRVRSHLATQDEAREHGRSLTLVDAAPQISCPLFVVTGKLDRLVPWQAAERLATEATGPTELLVIEDGNHVANNRAHAYRYRTADWMAQHLGGRL
ncbi:alpha/beta hydrolase family protein [Egicoccus sp. AB-alg6-2]|uniref:alpha/beta hydrolase family protein n=1 Tax=Egicoccus sp. AB-alg6-2 TaxID=3242692 RepID=UPI00359E3ECD